MLTEKDYCDYETCAALEGVGFPLHPYGNTEIDTSLRLTLLLCEAQKWLREEKEIFVYIDVPWKTDGGLGWSYFCCNKPMTEEDKEVCFASGGFYDSYEEALSEGIKQSIKILKEE
jgi:hypothetical protein